MRYPVTMDMQRALDIGWAAGFFDGEGSISMSKRPTGRISIELTITNTDLESLERFQKIVEGRGHIKKGQGNHLSKKQLWRYGAYKRDDFWYIMILLLPHLSKRRQEKAQEVMLALSEYVDGRSTHWSKREPVLDTEPPAPVES